LTIAAPILNQCSELGLAKNPVLLHSLLTLSTLRMMRSTFLQEIRGSVRVQAAVGPLNDAISTFNQSRQV
jgi:hypothetical protein